MASDSVDNHVLSDASISVSSKVILLSDLTFIGQTQAGSIVCISIRSCFWRKWYHIFNHFSSDASVPHGTWTRIADNAIQFPAEDKLKR